MKMFDHVKKEDVPLNDKLPCSAYERLSPNEVWYLRANYLRQNETGDTNPYSSYAVYEITIGLLNAVLDNNVSDFKNWAQRLKKLNLNGDFEIIVDYHNCPYNPYAPVGYQRYSGSVKKSLTELISSFKSPDPKIQQECLDLLKKAYLPEQSEIIVTQTDKETGSTCILM